MNSLQPATAAVAAFRVIRAEKGLVFPITCDHAVFANSLIRSTDHRILVVLGVPPFFHAFVASKEFPLFRPLRHAEFSTGSPGLFHWVTQHFAWVMQASEKPREAKSARTVCHPEPAAAFAASEGPESREAHPNYFPVGCTPKVRHLANQ